jgi:excisionase family DNA binding protein
MSYTLHPFNEAGEDYPPLLSIARTDGYNFVIGEEDVAEIIALLQRYQRGEHDGVISHRDPRTYRHVDDALNSLLTVSAVAEEYGLESGTVRTSIHKGYIPARKSGKFWLIRRADAEERWGSKKDDASS